MTWRYNILIVSLTVVLMMALSTYSVAMNNQEELEVYGDESPPLSYYNVKGEPIGENVKKVRGFLDSRVKNYSVNLAPWARVLNLAKNRKNVIIFNLDRTPEREKDFHWLMPLKETRYILLSRDNETMTKKTIEEIIASQDTIICERLSSPCIMLMNMGVSKDRLIQFTNVVSSRGPEMLFRGRADYLMVDDIILGDDWMKNYPNISGLKAANFSFSVTSYIAAHKNIAPRYLDKLIKDKSDRVEEQ